MGEDILSRLKRFKIKLRKVTRALKKYERRKSHGINVEKPKDLYLVAKCYARKIRKTEVELKRKQVESPEEVILTPRDVAHNPTFKKKEIKVCLYVC